jgi:chromosome segregation ATPase
METARTVGATAAPVGASASNLAGLGNRFVALFARRLPRDAFAAEIARLVMPALRALGVAVLGYDARRDRLVLLASEGLSDEARAALGNGADCPWDIPLRGLRNRRISVIAGAHKNPFVPKPLANVASRGLSIASLPIYSDHEPLGILLVFAAGNHSFADSQLQTLSQALRVCAPGVRAADASNRGVGPTAQPENVEATIAKLIAAGAIIDPATASAALQPEAETRSASTLPATPAAQQMMDDLVARVQGLERDLAKAQEGLDNSGRRIRQLTMNSNGLARERDGLAQRLADIESGHGSEVSELRAELNAAQERLLAVEGERARLHRLSEGRQHAAQQSISSLETERDTLLARAQSSEANVAELQTLLAAVFDERDRVTAHVETLTADLRAAQETLQRSQSETVQERGALEADRDGWKEEASTVRAQLAQRAEQLASVERDLRSTTVGRDATVAQLASSRAELERLSNLSDELTQSVSQLEASRAALGAENTALRKAFDEERGGRVAAESGLRAELHAAQTEAERLAASMDSLRADLADRVRALAERDEQLDQLKLAQDEARQSESGWQENATELRGELATLQARLEQTSAERQVLLEERATLRTALTEVRQRAGQNDVAHAATVGQLQAEVAELQRQVQTLGTDRGSLSERLQRSVDEGRELTRRLAETQRRADELGELARTRDAGLAESTVERERITAQLATLNGQLRAAQEGLERNLARATQERSAFETQRAGWEEQSAALQTELAQRTGTALELERELRSTVVARDAAASELQATLEDRDRLATLADSLRQSLAQTEADRDATAAGQTAMRRTLEAERAAHADAERSLRSDLTAARTEVERLGATATVVRNDLDDRTHLLAERDEQIAAFQREVEALRQESADRGVLAHQATELGRQVVDLEQQLAAVRGDAARAERQRAAVSEELGTVRRQQVEGAATAGRERAAWQDEQQRLLDERRRLEADAATLRGDLEARRAAHVELQTALEQAHADRGRAVAGEQSATRLLEDLKGVLQQRDGALAAATQARQQIVEQLQALKVELRETQAALEAARETEATGAEAQELAAQLQTARSQIHDLEAAGEKLHATLSETQERLQAADGAHRAAVQQLERDGAPLRTQLAELTAAHAGLTEHLRRSEELAAQRAASAEDESRRSAALVEQSAQLEATVRDAEDRRNAAQQELAQARTEIEALRQQSADRGVLAQQASELGGTVVELEQQLAAVRGAAAQAERQREVMAEELEAARRLQSQNEVIGDRKLATLRDAVDRLTEDRRRSEALCAEKTAEAEAQRATATELQTNLEQLRSERADAEGQGHDLAQRLGEAHRRLDDVGERLRQREAAIDTAGAERARLSAQVTKLANQLRASQEAIDSLQGRTALERAATEAERDRWREQANSNRAELETLLASTDAVSQDASQALAARTAAEAEIESLRRALDQERASRLQVEETMRAELFAARNDAEQLTDAAADQRTQLLEREEQLVALLQEQEVLRQAQAVAQQATTVARTELAAASATLSDATSELEQLRAERQRVEHELGEVVAARGDESQALAQQLQATRGQLRAIEHERGVLQAALNEQQQRSRELAGTQAAAMSQMQSTADELRQQVAELNAGRQQLSERLEHAERELVARAAQGDATSHEQTILSERCQQLEQQLSAADSRRAAADAELAQARNEIDAWRARNAESGALADHADELGKRLADMEQQLATLRGEATRAERQRAIVAEELQAANALRDQVIKAAEGEQARLHDKLQQLTEERKRVEAMQAQQQGELEAHRASLAELRSSLDETRSERMQLEQEGQDLAHQLGETQRRLQEMSVQLQERDQAIEVSVADRRRLEDAVRAAEQTAQQISSERDADLGSDLVLHVREERRTTSSLGPEIGSEAVLVIERSAPLSEALDGGDSTYSADAPSVEDEPSAFVGAISAEPVRELVLLDAGKRGDEASSALRSAGFEVSLAAPVEGAVEQLAGRNISCVMLNLAAGPQAWHTLKRLRETESTRSVPILAYLMPPDGQKGFCFGRADFSFWPVAPAELIERLELLRPKLKRLLAVSSDIDGMGELRDPLAMASISTSIVLDGKQALEYTTIVAPEAAVLHLSPRTNAVARAIAGIRAQETTARLPMLLLLDKAPPREEIFFAATVRELMVKGTFQFNRLPAEIARVIA